MKEETKKGLAVVGILAAIAGGAALARKVEAEPCQLGAPRCSGTTLEECDENGNWVVVEENSETCGWTPDPPPICQEGETRCQGYTLQRCQNANWVTAELNSTECGWVPGEKVRIYNLCCPSSVIAGYPFQIGFRAAVSEEDQPACRTVQLKMNGQLIETINACLPWNRQLAHYFRFSEMTLALGVYEISVNGLTATLEVRQLEDVITPIQTTELWDIHDAPWFRWRVEHSGDQYAVLDGCSFQEPDLIDLGCALSSPPDYYTWWKARVNYTSPGREHYEGWKPSLIFIPQERTNQIISALISDELDYRERRRALPPYIETAWRTARLNGGGGQGQIISCEGPVTSAVIHWSNFYMSERNEGIVERIESRIPNVTGHIIGPTLIIDQTLGNQWVTFHGMSPNRLEGIEPNVLSFEFQYMQGPLLPWVEGWLNLKVEPISGQWDVIWKVDFYVYVDGEPERFNRATGAMVYGWKVGEVNP